MFIHCQACDAIISAKSGHDFDVEVPPSAACFTINYDAYGRANSFDNQQTFTIQPPV
jgi:hypothetical protein